MYRYLSTIERINYEHRLLSTSQSNLRCNVAQHPLRIHYEQKRFITLHVPGSDQNTSTPRKYDTKVPLRFPPGKPNDKPKLEHLRFVEEQLKLILPDFCKRMHPYGLYTADLIFENYYDNPPKVIKGAGSYALAMFWIRTKLNFKLMNVTVHLLNTTIDEESNCVKVRWRISGLSNKSFVGVLKGWRKPRDVSGNIRDYIEHVDGLSTFYVRGDGRIYKHRVDRAMVDEDKEPAPSLLNKKKLAPINLLSSISIYNSSDRSLWQHIAHEMLLGS
ncbi:unnamed protein product [Adineta ricciae]|uniref:Uncharacterized protein n=1 Tax=Adineta ricciae TaxID=249248 RepID=A0A814Y933_ADIRI|nr:unnamed protein product [Adineta ricciae]